MANFHVGDLPVASFEYELPDAFHGTTVRGVETAGQSITVTVHGDSTFSNTWSALTLPAPGAYPVMALADLDGRVQRVQVDTLVVDDPASGWLTLASARDEWSDAPADDGQLFRLLTAAREQCEAFAPVTVGPAPVRFRQAQLMQARALWNAGHTSQDQFSADGLTVTAFPMDWQVKALLRPKRAVGGMF